MPPRKPGVFSVDYEEIEIRTVARRKRLKVMARSKSEAARLAKRIAVEDLSMEGVRTEGLVRMDQIGAPVYLGCECCARNFREPIEETM